jgi:hypothetical protein
MFSYKNKGISMSAMVIIVVVACVLATGIFIYKQGLVPKSEPKPGPENSVGKDTDEHGCLITAGYSWCEAKQKCLIIWEEDCIIGEEPEINFTKTGNLVDKSTELEENWVLIYEEPGKPALSVSLDFTQNSICAAGNETGLCWDTELVGGERITIGGIKAENSDMVTVVRLTIIE